MYKSRKVNTGIPIPGLFLIIKGVYAKKYKKGKYTHFISVFYVQIKSDTWVNYHMIRNSGTRKFEFVAICHLGLTVSIYIYVSIHHNYMLWKKNTMMIKIKCDYTNFTCTFVFVDCWFMIRSLYRHFVHYLI